MTVKKIVSKPSVNVAPNTRGVQEKEDIYCLLSAARLLGIERSAE